MKRRWFFWFGFAFILAVGSFMLRPTTACRPDERDYEAVMLADLYQMRSCIDVHRYRTGRYPRDMEALIGFGCLRDVPMDPITKSNDTWVLQRNDEGEIMDVHSGAPGVGLDGTRYRVW